MALPLSVASFVSKVSEIMFSLLLYVRSCILKDGDTHD